MQTQLSISNTRLMASSCNLTPSPSEIAPGKVVGYKIWRQNFRPQNMTELLEFDNDAKMVSSQCDCKLLRTPLQPVTWTLDW